MSKYRIRKGSFVDMSRYWLAGMIVGFALVAFM